MTTLLRTAVSDDVGTVIGDEPAVDPHQNRPDRRHDTEDFRLCDGWWSRCRQSDLPAPPGPVSARPKISDRDGGTLFVPELPITVHYWLVI